MPTIFETGVAWTPFVWFNLWVTAATTLVFLALFCWKRHVFVKPSVQVLGCYHLLGQWSATLLAAHAETYLGEPWTAFIYLHAFVCAGLILSAAMWNQTARHIWQQLGDQCPLTAPRSQVVLAISGMLGLAGIYLLYVPPSATGLAALLFDPENAMQAREDALKLLDSWIPKYALELASKTFAPVVTGMAVYNAYILWRDRKRRAALMWLSLLLSVFVVALLGGAKGTLVLLVLVAVTVIAWQRHLSFSLFWIAGAVATVLAPAVLISLHLALTQDAAGFDGTTGEALALVIEGVIDRSFLAIGGLNIWYMDFAQKVGPIGIAGIPKLAALFSVDSIDLPNTIGRTYGPERYGGEIVDSISANGGYLYAFYVYFGAWGLVISVVALLTADFLLVLIRRLPAFWIAPILAANTLGAMTFAAADFLTSLVTHGFATRVLLVWSIVAIAGMGSDLRRARRRFRVTDSFRQLDATSSVDTA